MDLLTPTEAAALLRVSRRRIYDLVRSGELAAYRLGPKTLRIERAELDRFLAERSACHRAAVLSGTQG